MTILPNKIDILSRFHQTNNTVPLPEYLLQMIIVTGMFSDQSKEPELQQCQKAMWQCAAISIHKELENEDTDSCTELIQALLLLSIQWPGTLNQYERINTFVSALNLASRMQLLIYKVETHTWKQVTLFWVMYCYDKIISLATRKPPSISWTSHNVPLPTTEVIALALGTLKSDGKECIWLHWLIATFIKVCHALEEVLLEPSYEGIASEQKSVRQVIREGNIENILKDHLSTLSNIRNLSPACQALSHAVISLIHLTRLALYYPTLLWARSSHEYWEKALSLRRNDLNLGIESACHLAQLDTGIQDGSGSKVDRATKIGLVEHAMNFSRACKQYGNNILEELDLLWLTKDDNMSQTFHTSFLDSSLPKGNDTNPTCLRVRCNIHYSPSFEHSRARDPKAANEIEIIHHEATQDTGSPRSTNCVSEVKAYEFDHHNPLAKLLESDPAKSECISQLRKENTNFGTSSPLKKDTTKSDLHDVHLGFRPAYVLEESQGQCMQKRALPDACFPQCMCTEKQRQDGHESSNICAHELESEKYITTASYSRQAHQKFDIAFINNAGNLPDI